MWGDDYPRHEETCSHSLEAVQPTSGGLRDEQPAKALGLSAARLFRFAVPAV